MKIAIGFFGITRSLKYTIESININIKAALDGQDLYLQPLKPQSMSTAIFMIFTDVNPLFDLTI